MNMKIGTALLVAEETIGYLVTLGLLDAVGNLTAPTVQQDLLIAAFVEESIRKHTPKSAVSLDSTDVNAIIQIVTLILGFFGKK